MTDTKALTSNTLALKSHPRLVMEQPQRRPAHHHPIPVRRLDALRVHHTATRRGEIRDAALARAVHVVGEGEEGVGGAGDAGELRRPRLLIRLGEEGGGA